MDPRAERPEDLPEILRWAEEEAESLDSSWTEFLRNIRGDEPFHRLPVIFRVFLCVALLGPLALVLFAEWSWRRWIPLWMSVPLTLVGVGLAILRRSRARRTGGER